MFGGLSTYLSGMVAAPLHRKYIKKFYNEDRLKHEILNINNEWNGWFVAADGGKVVGAGGGGMIDEETAKL